MNKSKDVWIALGHEWHDLMGYATYRPVCLCGYTCKTDSGMNQHIKTSNPDLASREGTVLLLEEMMKQKDWNEFYKWMADEKQLFDYNSQGTG